MLQQDINWAFLNSFQVPKRLLHGAAWFSQKLYMSVMLDNKAGKFMTPSQPNRFKSYTSCYFITPVLMSLRPGMSLCLKILIIFWWFLIFHALAEVIDRFLKDLNKEQQAVVWRKCVTSIATRCKTLRYNRSKVQMAQGEHQWTIHPSHVTDDKPQ